MPAYRHLGTWLQAGNVHAKEVAKRGAIARATWGVSPSLFTTSLMSLLLPKLKSSVPQP